MVWLHSGSRPPTTLADLIAGVGGDPFAVAAVGPRMFNLKSTRKTPDDAPPPSPADAAPTDTISPDTEPAVARDAAASESSEARRRGTIAAARRTLSFGQIVGELMRSPLYKHYTLADLEWLVVPAVMTGQFAIGQTSAKKGGPRSPAAVALWASVSAEVDARLTANPQEALRLRPDEWRSGDILWLVAAAGDPRILPKFLQKLGETTFKDRPVKVRRRKPSGATTIGGLPKKS